tara:strand:- start:283 stop:720 length:438 start_codon:yes stop_codon:yes gene_type:complete
MTYDPVSKISILNNLRNNKLYLYKNVHNSDNEFVSKYGCRILILLNILHIIVIYLGILFGLILKNKNNLIFLLFLYILFYILAFYSSGCWLSLPEIIINDKYNCRKKYKFSNNMWILRDIMLPNVTTTMLLYTPLTIYVIYKILN